MNHAAPHRRSIAILISITLAVYASARLLEITHNPLPRMSIVTLDVLSAAAFALLHGPLHYRLRGILIFALIAAVIGNIVENIGVVTGFPFGRYYFLELMGPKLFHVPVLLGLAYIGMAYVSWTIARIILGNLSAANNGARIFALSLLASCAFVSWDLAQDPVWATVLHGWVWLDGGPWFGVPVSNYLGWFGTAFVIYLLFALYLRCFPAPAITPSRLNWLPAILFYLLCAAGNVAQCFLPANPAVVADPTGKEWLVAEITRASALISIFIMGGFGLFAWIQLVRRKILSAE